MRPFTEMTLIDWIDPINIDGGSGVNARIFGISTFMTPRDNADQGGPSILSDNQRTTRIALACIFASGAQQTGAQHVIGDSGSARVILIIRSTGPLIDHRHIDRMQITWTIITHRSCAKARNRSHCTDRWLIVVNGNGANSWAKGQCLTQQNHCYIVVIKCWHIETGMLNDSGGLHQYTSAIILRRPGTHLESRDLVNTGCAMSGAYNFSGRYYWSAAERDIVVDQQHLPIKIFYACRRSADNKTLDIGIHWSTICTCNLNWM